MDFRVLRRVTSRLTPARRGVRAAASGTSASGKIPKRLALPVFAANAVSSLAYAPDQILLALSLAGLAAVKISPWLGLAVALVMAITVASYRYLIRAYPAGAGYRAAQENLGPGAALAVASALAIDYVLTVAVSVSAGATYLVRTFTALAPYRLVVALGLLSILAAVMLRIIWDSAHGSLRKRRRASRTLGSVFAVPVYLYIVVVAAIVLTGLIRAATSHLEPAASAAYQVVPGAQFENGLVGVGGALLLLRAFSSGCVSLTGVETIANRVHSLRRPRIENAQATLTTLGVISAALLVGTLLLARWTGVIYVADPGQRLLVRGRLPGKDFHLEPVMTQLARTVFGSNGWAVSLAAVIVVILTCAVLALAAYSAFSRVPELITWLSRDGYLPRQVRASSQRLAHANVSVLLWLASGAFIIIFDAEPARLIQLYVLGVFIAFALSQIAMVAHGTRTLRIETAPEERARISRARAVNLVGAVVSAAVVLTIITTKITRGAWIALLFMLIFYVIMSAIHRHYRNVAAGLEVDAEQTTHLMPTRVRAYVLVSAVDQPTVRALNYARVSRPYHLSAITVEVADGYSERLRRQWEQAGIDVDLTTLHSPDKQLATPVVEFVRTLRHAAPRELIALYFPTVIFSSRLARPLHNQSLKSLRAELERIPNVMLVDVPYFYDDDGHDTPSRALAAKVRAEKSSTKIMRKTAPPR